MLKYTNYQVTFSEVPNEITLTIELSNCPFRCDGCHSKHLWKNVGDELTNDRLYQLIKDNAGITCVCLMGGDLNKDDVKESFKYIKDSFKDIKTAWYSGDDKIPDKEFLKYLNYLKIGPYLKDFGPINKRTTNQVFYEIFDDGSLFDITYKFWGF